MLVFEAKKTTTIMTSTVLLLQFFSRYPAMGVTLYRWSVMA